MRFDRIWLGARLLTLDPSRDGGEIGGGDRSGATKGSASGSGRGLGLVERGAVAALDGRIAFAGPEAELPSGWDAAERIACEGRLVTPGLVDCHTHLVHGGHRAREFEMRLEGASYEDVAREGGGILSTVRATRAADEDELLRQSLPRLDALLAEGVTTIEIKSGYGLEPDAERRQLRAARRLGELRDVRVRTSFLGAHALPPEFRDNRAAYVDLMCGMIPELAREGLADAVDAFCEGIAFTPDEVARLFEAARASGLPVKLHADQLSNGGGAALAARFRALSADHLEWTDEAGAAALAAAGTVAVLLPGAFYSLRETKVPPVHALRRARTPIALATDCNPGTSPLTSLLLTMNMGATLFRLTVAECLAAVTREAARALGLLDEIGTLQAGKACDLAIWNVEEPSELVYRLGFNPLHARVRNGQ